ncbi:NADH-ubiquinone reductase complex 1 MLRQ subunit [Phaffia rhodozyma]|uniref:NADH-ubiquinone reductase complex 1 MLRQ subunit n=1 Tax=Phaffia rhodozyma TaxID=264483 RepID=A0A0F7SXT2_PHARH|nr:NADH-ubiquinone reductase complex 1 MLRQ subunit [Phaffia rhodozyma]
MPKVPTPLFRKSVFAYEILPIYAVVIGAVGGAGWYLSRLARGPDVLPRHFSLTNVILRSSSLIWDRNGNPQPWQHIKENQQVKLLAINHKHEGEPWRRDRF